MIPERNIRPKVRRATAKAVTLPVAELVTRQQVKQMIHSIVDEELEDKFFDTVLTPNVAVDWFGRVPASITDIPQGLTDLSRIGDSLRVKKLTWSVMVAYNQKNTTTDLASSCSAMRLLIFAWKPFFADVAPTVAKVVTYTGIASACHGPLVHDGKNQSTILVDQVVILDGFTKPQKLFRGSMKLNHKIDFKNASTTNGSNGIYFTVMSDAVAASGTYPYLLNFNFRVDYQDA